MSLEYRPPLDDIGFVLRHVVDYDAIAKLEPYAHADLDTAIGLLDAGGEEPPCGEFACARVE